MGTEALQSEALLSCRVGEDRRPKEHRADGQACCGVYLESQFMSCYRSRKGIRPFSENMDMT